MMTSRRLPSAALAKARQWLAILALGAVATPALGQTWEWAFIPSTQSTQLTGFASGADLLAFGSGGSVYVLQQATGEARHPPFGIGGLARRPTFARLFEASTQEDHLFLFATGPGDLYKFDVTQSVPSAALQVDVVAGQQQIRDLRRAACPTDSAIAEPVVQRRADSGPGFTLNVDIVIVATAHDCGDTAQNTVVAFDAANVRAPPVWNFNNGEYEVGRINSCLLDRARNRVYCGADVPAGLFQPGLFAIDTVDGSLEWLGSIGSSVRALAALGDASGPGAGHLYVGDAAGRVLVLDAATGNEIDTEQLLPAGTAIGRDLAVGSGASAGLVYAVDGAQRLVALFDTGTELLEAWQTVLPGGAGAVTPATPHDARGKLYVGASSGRFHQLDSSAGAAEASGPFAAPGPGRVMAPLLLYRSLQGGDRLVGGEFNTGGGAVVAQYRVPCAFGSSCTPDAFVFADGFE